MTATVTVCLGADESVATGSCSSAASPISTATAAAVLSEANRVSLASRRLAAALMVSIVTSRARGAASLGVEAWLVSVS